MSLFEQLNPQGSLYCGPVCRARNENIEGASCEFVAFGTGAHLCIRPKDHDEMKDCASFQSDAAEGAVAHFYRVLGDDHVCECGVRWK